MRFYTRQHKHYCGIDLHARMMYLCVLNGELLSSLVYEMPQACAIRRRFSAVPADCLTPELHP